MEAQDQTSNEENQTEIAVRTSKPVKSCKQRFQPTI